MNKTALLVITSFFILLMAISAQGLLNSGQPYSDGRYANDLYPTDRQSLGWQDSGPYSDQTAFETKADVGYSSIVPSGAPVPVAPDSPENLGLQVPAEAVAKLATYTQAPPAAETSRGLIPASASTAGQLTNDVQGAQYNYNYPSQSQSMMVVPQDISATNRLYVSYVPQTVAGCSLYGWLPMWLQTFSSGPIWFYEWYPDGRLSVNYLGFSSEGWQKKGFNGDAPGWHILQYYSQGWSNYIYVYVHGATPKPPSGTSSVTLRSSWFKGYAVYLDGKYVGMEGSGSDLLDGIYNFRVPGNMLHTIVISKNGQSYDETGTFLSGAAYRFTL
jgi:hypothetical protein